jgi:hypothetical protein
LVNDRLSNLNKKNKIALFGIVQGGREEVLRKKSAKIISGGQRPRGAEAPVFLFKGEGRGKRGESRRGSRA